MALRRALKHQRGLLWTFVAPFLPTQLTALGSPRMEFNSSTRIYRKIKKCSESRLTIWYTSDVNTSCGNVSTDKESHFTLLRDTKNGNSPLRKLEGEWVQVFVAVISGIVSVDKRQLWLVESMVSKTTINQSQVTLVHSNDARNRCTECLYPFPV